jgi:hypothetical protein
MATNTYVALDSRTLSTAVPSVTFTSISQAYTDLVIVVNATVASGLCNVTMNFGDTSTLYSRTNLIGNGSTAVSNRQTGEALTYICTVGTTSVSAGTAQIMNYSNTTVNKTYFLKDVYSASAVIQRAGLWRNTNAISTVVIGNDGGVNFAIGSTFTLYGIAAEGITPVPKATGGAIYSDLLYYYHVFGQTGVFTPTTSITADILVVAGGGAGGSEIGGGGGAGGLLAFTSQSLTATNYTCTVGGGASRSSGTSAGANGTNSTFQGLTAAVGGGGGGALTINGVAGGSGGGGGRQSSGAASNASGQGFAGGNGQYPSPSGGFGGGGGGAGAVGQAAQWNGSLGSGGVGGIGATSSFINAIGLATGTGQTVSSTTYFSGGGGGGGENTGTGAASGGLGGGGNGAYNPTTGINGINALVNTGGGGGAGGGSSPATGGAGGSGIIIVRYLKA